MKRAFVLVSLLLALFAWPAACGRLTQPAAQQPAASPDGSRAERQQVSRCSYGRVSTADAGIIGEAIRQTFPPSPDNTYDVLGVYYAQPARGDSYTFLAVLRVVGIAGPSILLFDQVTGDFERGTRIATNLARTTYDPTRCPEISTASPTP